MYHRGTMPDRATERQELNRLQDFTTSSRTGTAFALGPPPPDSLPIGLYVKQILHRWP